LPPGEALTGPASPRRSVCAPAALAFSWTADHLFPRKGTLMNSHASRRTRQRSGTFRPRLEALENRHLPSYSIAPVAILGHLAPGPEGGTFTFDFESGPLNNKGQVVFTADLDEGAGDAGEGVFLGGKGGLSQVVRVGEPAPGGGTFGGFGTASPDALNDAGDAAFAFGRDSLTFPIGVNAGVYRYDHASRRLTAVLVPGVTAAPGGGIFAGTLFHPSLNNGGDLVFPGIVPATIGPGASIDLGVGIFLADSQGHLTKVVRPGDAAPGGSTFDFAQNPDINDRGDIGFGAHIAADPCLESSPGQTLPTVIFCAESVYVKDGATGVIRSIAHQGAAIPASAGGGTFDYAYAPVLNSRGQILFDAGLQGTSTLFFGSPVDSQAIFLSSNGNLIAIARPGDAVPGGGHIVTASFNPGNYDLNNNGDVAFNALLDTGDEGVFLWSHGALSLVAKTGTVVPGVGTIASLDQYGSGLPNGYVHLNARGQVAFGVTLTDGGGALLLATPTGPLVRMSLTGAGTPGPASETILAALLPLERTSVPGAFGQDLQVTPDQRLAQAFAVPSPAEQASGVAAHEVSVRAEVSPTSPLETTRCAAVRDRVLAADPDGLLSASLADDWSLPWMG
jgi:hypothetical protein